MSEFSQKEEDFQSYYQLATERLRKMDDAEEIILALKKYARENFDEERYKLTR